MKIAYLFSRYPVPSQTFCDTEIRALEAAGHQVEICSCSAPTTSFRHGGHADWPRAEILYAPPRAVLDAWEQAARADGTWPTTMVAEHLRRFGERYDPARRARHALYFADQLRRRGVEHLHVHFANRATHAALFIHELTGLPFSFTAHAQDFLVDLGSDDLLRLMCERAAFVVAVSDWSRVELVRRCPDAASKIHRVHNGLALEPWPAPSDQSRTAGVGLRILSVGRLIGFKGFEDLIAACRLLHERGVPFSCEIVGEGPLRESLERQAAEFTRAGSQVRFSGLLPQAEVRARLQSCDVFALASRLDEKGACDVLPTVILEAMAAGKPVVSTRLAGIPEMVEPGRTGWLVAPGDVPAFADALAASARQVDETHALGQAGRRKLEAEFSADQAVRRLAGLFSVARLAGSGQPPGDSYPASPDIIILLDRWPLAEKPYGELVGQALAQLRRRRPGLHLMALKPGSLLGSSDESLPPGFADTLHTVNFLPDDVVFETGWRHFVERVHQLESWRGEPGGAYEPDEFLLASRRALYLWATRLDDLQSGHLHAVGRSSLLCAWLLRRMGAVRSASFLLLPQAGGGSGVLGSALRKLAPAFSGGWVVQERKLAAALGETFRGDVFDGPAWVEAVTSRAFSR